MIPFFPIRMCCSFFKVFPQDRFLNGVIWIISVVLRGNDLIILDSIGEPVSMESELVRVISLGTTEISEITRLKIRSLGSEYLRF